MVDEHFATQNLQLYSEEACFRDNLLSKVSYDLKLTLSDTLEQGYSGHLQISFDLSELPEDMPMFLDFQGKQISNIVLNGHSNPGCGFEYHRIWMPSDKLQIGSNTIAFDFENSYVVNSAGLHFYKDP